MVIDPDFEDCSVCGEPVYINDVRWSLSVPLCLTCWVEEQRGF